MNKLLTILLGWLFALGLSAQTDGRLIPVHTDTTKVLHADSLSVRMAATGGYEPEGISTPTLDAETSPMYFMPGTLTGDWTGWRLHEGFNAQLGMSLTAGIGKHAPRGVGFGDRKSVV